MQMTTLFIQTTLFNADDQTFSRWLHPAAAMLPNPAALLLSSSTPLLSCCTALLCWETNLCVVNTRRLWRALPSTYSYCLALSPFKGWKSSFKFSLHIWIICWVSSLATAEVWCVVMWVLRLHVTGQINPHDRSASFPPCLVWLEGEWHYRLDGVILSLLCVAACPLFARFPTLSSFSASFV